MSEDTLTTPDPPAPPGPVVGAPAPAPAPEPPRRRRPASATAGIVLILVGLIVLIGNVLPGIGWWNLWPLIIVVAGLIQAFTPGKEGWSLARMFDGLTTVAIGGVFLAIVFGVVGWAVWGTILSLWPVLVISIGLDLLGKSLGTSWLKVLGSLVVIGALAYAISAHASGASGFVWFARGDVESAEISEPVGDVEEATLKVESGVSSVELRGGRRLVEAQGETPFGEPEFAVNRESTHADVLLSLGGGPAVIGVPGGTEASLDARIATTVLWDIEVQTGVSRLDADLRDVPVRAFNLKPGVAECDVTLGDAPDGEVGTVDVSSGISSVIIRLPEDAEVRVESESGLSGIDIAQGIDKIGTGEWETDGFDEARKDGDPIWIVHVNSAIGSFTLDTY